MEHLDAIATTSMFVCPECQGGLWQLTGSRPPRYRCHTGHGFTLRSLQYCQSEATDEALWSAIRALQEKRLLLDRMVVERHAEGDAVEAARLQTAAGEIQRQAELLRKLVEAVPEPAA